MIQVSCFDSLDRFEPCFKIKIHDADCAFRMYYATIFKKTQYLQLNIVNI